MSSTSPFVRKVLVSAHELGPSDRLETIPLAWRRVSLRPGFIAIQPAWAAPQHSFLDDGSVLYDSLVIIEHSIIWLAALNSFRLRQSSELKSWLHALCNGFRPFSAMAHRISQGRKTDCTH
ncbi:glutathione S-transferase N-terminal domain-containing protein [Rhizobium beringeri]